MAARGGIGVRRRNAEPGAGRDGDEGSAWRGQQRRMTGLGVARQASSSGMEGGREGGAVLDCGGDDLTGVDIYTNFKHRKVRRNFYLKKYIGSTAAHGYDGALRSK